MVITPNIIRETAKGREPVRIVDELLTKRKIFLTDQVNEESCTSLIKQLMYLETDAPGEEIKLYINSPGGEVSSGLAVYDFITMMTSPVTTVCIGDAASMGAILFLAGTKRMMLPHSRIMIHDPHFSNADFSGQKPGEIEEKLNDLKATRNKLVKIISQRTGKPEEEVFKKTEKDSWFDVSEAIGFGLATEEIKDSTGLF
ncbi:MAG: ATP-dependent Clp protease proteolytic subunit [Ruminococcus sp.]|nr:ATP-dependent Clp protease proteolytic subunit [Ruminococcus sp.]MBR1862686.1 ATP-dependent Clp protease proteolytic subunit [Ruminococcus sp.]